MENIAQCWMSTKEKQIFSFDFPPAMSNSHNSWEETAFAKDMRAGILGGCMWPPRFYSCTFCEREFKSAQALGGHMNVHRRDRARLKHGSLPKPSSGKRTTTSPDTFPPSNVKALSAIEQFMMSSHCSSTVRREQYKKPWFNSQTDNDGVREETGDCVQTNLSIALKSSVDKRSPAVDEAIPHKRCKISFSSLPDFVMSSCSSAGCLSLKSADVILGVTPAGIEDLDLELRLGDPQRVLI